MKIDNFVDQPYFGKQQNNLTVTKLLILNVH